MGLAKYKHLSYFTFILIFISFVGAEDPSNLIKNLSSNTNEIQLNLSSSNISQSDNGIKIVVDSPENETVPISVKIADPEYSGSIKSTENGSLQLHGDVNSNRDDFDSLRGDVLPYETDGSYVKNHSFNSTESQTNHQSIKPLASRDNPVTFTKMSWLDAFLFNYRGPLWIIFNSIFMGIWIIIGAFALYRLLGLPWCSIYLTRTQYLLVHLLIFTSATFEFVQLIHLSYGSHEGLPLFLTLLLTHTPTPCIAISLLIMIYSVFVSTGIPIFGKYYAPPSIYISIIAGFIIIISFVGDIIVGISRSSICLILFRATLNTLCVVCFLIYLCNYSELHRIGQCMRREVRENLRSLSLPLDASINDEDGQDSKRHLKTMFLSWSRIAMFSCILGILMCALSFSLSLFFTVSYVPLWAFWVIHSSLFAIQVILVIMLTWGAFATLNDVSVKCKAYRYFFPSLSNGNTSQQASYIKRGNFVYQRVSMPQGRTVPQVMTAGVIDEEEPLQNNVKVYSRGNINLKRSASFSCPSPYGVYHRPNPVVHCHSHVYPVLSDHILPQSNTFKPNVNDYGNYTAHRVRGNLSSHSFSYGGNDRRRNFGPYYRYRRKYQGSFLGNPDYISVGTQNSIEPQGLIVPSATNDVRLTSTCRIPNTAVDLMEHSADCVDTSGRDDLVYSNLLPLPTSYQEDFCQPVLNSDYQSTKLLERKDNMSTSIPLSEFPSFSNLSTKAYKQTPPKKPARIEPRATKDVNGENSISNDNSSFGVELNAFDANMASSGYYDCDESLKTPKDEREFVFNTERPHPVTSHKFAEKSCNKYGNFNDGRCPKVLEPLILSNDSASPVIDINSLSFQDHRFPTSKMNSFPLATPEEDEDLASEESCPREQNGHSADIASFKTDFTVESDSGMPDCGSSFDSESVVSGASLPTRRFLKRNHSSVGDSTSRSSAVDETRKDSLQGPFGTKHPWYETWNGRKKGKNSSATELKPQRELDNETKQLSSSKSSLSNLYGKIRTKRSKSMYQQTPVSNPVEVTNGKSLNDLTTSQSSKDIPAEPELEQDFQLLPKISEDIDLASEILESSSALYDFYSLKRSDLKKRKQNKDATGLGNDQEVQQLCNGAVDDSNVNTNLLVTNGHAEEVLAS